MIYLQLLWSFLQIGLFSFGGGYASVPLIEAQVVTAHAWMTPMEFMDIITISQMTPGPVAINCATFVGLKIAGIGGALVATFGCVLPSCVIVLALAKLYEKYYHTAGVQGVLAGLRPAILALIAAAGVSILQMSFFPLLESGAGISLRTTDWLAVVLCAAVLLILRKWKCNPIFLMLGAGGLALAGYGICLACGLPFPPLSA